MYEILFGGLSSLWVVFALLVLILTILTPFFILKIRNQVVMMNNKFDTIIKLLGGGQKLEPETKEELHDNTAPW